MSPVAPCVPWATIEDLPESCDDVAVKPETLTTALDYASVVLYNLTRRRWPGLCTDTYRPLCGNLCYGTPRPIRLEDGWHNCACYPHEAIRLPASDVIAISEVKVGGVVVPANEYALRDHRYLYATRQADGTYRTWPCWNDLHNDATMADTFQIIYTHGASPPASMVRASALLGWEFVLAWTPDCAGGCRLPKRVTTLSRGGTTFAIIDPLTLFKDGLVGVPDIDVLIQAVNRGESAKRAFVGRPGSPTTVIRQP
jgi:hypothetical protein